MQTGAKGLGCYKCGKKGHWSRDCTVPQSEWMNVQNVPGQAAGPSQASANATQNAAVGIAPLALKAKKKRVAKPKLTFEVLQRPHDGLPVVFLTFAERFKKKFKGHGHEGSDLRRLLEMYERWQHNLFPSLGFDDFLAEVEKIGRTAEVKKEMRELRRGAIRLLDEEDGPDTERDREQEITPNPRPLGSNAADEPESCAVRTEENNETHATEEGQRLEAFGSETEDELNALANDETLHEGAPGEAFDDDLMNELMDEDQEDPPTRQTARQETGQQENAKQGSGMDRIASDAKTDGPSENEAGLPSGGDSSNQASPSGGKALGDIELDTTKSPVKPQAAPKRQRIDSDSD